MVKADSASDPKALRGAEDFSDEELMEAYSKDVPMAFERLLPRFSGRLWGYFAKSFRSSAVADDLFQTTLLKLHRARASYRPGAAFRPWLFGIASRVRIDEFRRLYKVKSEEELGHAAVHQSSRDPEIDQRDRQVRDAVAALPVSQSEVVMLHRFAGLSFAEIAEVLSEKEGAPVLEGAVRARAFRAYATLRVTLASMESE